MLSLPDSTGAADTLVAVGAVTLAFVPMIYAMRGQSLFSVALTMTMGFFALGLAASGPNDVLASALLIWLGALLIGLTESLRESIRAGVRQLTSPPPPDDNRPS